MSNSRHFYSASAVGVGAVLTSPAPNAESWGASCLPIIGGRSASPLAGPVAWPTAGDPVLRFDSAQTVVTGSQTAPGVYTTTMRKTVTGLNILNRVTARIDVELVFTYTDGTCTPPPPPPRQRDPVAVTIIEHVLAVSIDGMAMPFSLNRPAPPQIADSAGRDFMKFLQPGPQGIGALRPAAGHHEHEHGKGGPCGHRQGVIFTALAEPLGATVFTYADPDFGLVSRPNLNVYFGEWHGEPYHQSFTVLRVELQNARDPLNQSGSAFTGSIVIDGDENGRTVP